MQTVVGSPIATTLAQLVAGSTAPTSPEVRSQVDTVLARLAGPLRVAVLGRRGAGKSTLVNVVIGAQVAATDLRECTRIPTWFRRGHHDGLEVVGTDGGRTAYGLDDEGCVPDELGRPFAEIDHLDVTVTSAALDHLVVIDTPGLATTDEDRARRTRELVEGRDMAEAVVLVLGATARHDAAALLTDLRQESAALDATPLNTVVVINQVDRFARRGDPWVAADQLVATYREVLGGQVAGVVPLVGVLAATVLAGRLGHAEVAALRTLAAEDEIGVDDLGTVEDVLEARSTVTREMRQALMRLLSPYGLTEAVRLLRSGPVTDRELHLHLLDRSGQPALVEMLEGALRGQADALKAAWGVARLEEIAGTAPEAERRALRSLVEEFLADPAAHRLRLAQVGGAHARGELALPAELADDLSRLLGGRDPATRLGCPAETATTTLRDAAQQAITRWSLWAATADPVQARAAAQVRRGYHLLWSELGAEAS